MNFLRMFIWTVPDFCSFQHYFRVKDAYVSHGKLVIRHPSDSGSQKPLLSLWDIRKSFPPVRAGSFSVGLYLRYLLNTYIKCSSRRNYHAS
ncbi:hypothetical protein RMCBS344292_14404 [Rhizopus microsporus]|nr:hypothetical protein RMCBS344292_14404 [Rhizopus microsporus]